MKLTGTLSQRLAEPFKLVKSIYHSRQILKNNVGIYFEQQFVNSAYFYDVKDFK